MGTTCFATVVCIMPRVQRGGGDGPSTMKVEGQCTWTCDMAVETCIAHLPDELLCRVLLHLSHPKDVANAECTCRWMRSCVVRGPSWQALAARGGGARLAELCRNTGEAKRLVRCLYRAQDEQLAAEVMRSSSVDRPEEEARHVLRPSAERRRERHRFHHPTYWSSSGTLPEHAHFDPTSDVQSAERRDMDVEGKRCVEWIELRLSTSVAVVEAVQIQAFRAHFQPNSPLYAPDEARIVRLLQMQEVDGHGFADGSEDRDVWEDQGNWHPVEPIDQVQTWSAGSKEACLGGCVRLELRGKPQKQEADGLHYVCLSRVRLFGRAVRGVRLVKDEDGWRLDFDALDETMGEGKDGEEESHRRVGRAWWEDTETTSKWDGWMSDQCTDSEEESEEVDVNDWLLQALLVRHMQAERD